MDTKYAMLATDEIEQCKESCSHSIVPANLIFMMTNCV